MMKRVRLTVEWDGACSESDWAERLACAIEDAIEESDISGVTRVVKTELLTTIGTTEPRELNPDEQAECDRRVAKWRAEYRMEHPTIWSRLFA